MVEQVQPAFDTLKKTFKSKKTQNVGFRKEQLGKLMAGLGRMKVEFEEAIFKDMGRDQMYTEQAEIGGTMSAIKWDLKNIDWMTKNETIETELLNAPAKTLIKKYLNMTLFDPGHAKNEKRARQLRQRTPYSREKKTLPGHCGTGRGFSENQYHIEWKHV